MKSINIFSLTLLMLLFLSCSSENEPQAENIEEQEEVSDDPDGPGSSVEEIVYFTYQSLQLNGLENWIIIHDENGNLVDYKQITQAGSVDFSIEEDVLPTKLSATKLSYSTNGAATSLYHSLSTYTDLEIGSVWEDRPNSFEGNLIGIFDLQVNNISEVENVLITTPSGILRAGSSNADEITGTSLQLMDIPLYADQEYLISIRGTDGLTRYLLLMPETDMNYEYDYAALQEFDEDFPLDLPPNGFNLCFTGGIKTSNSNTFWNYGHRFGEYIGSASGVLNLGYVDGYERYRFGLTITRDDFTYSYQSIGDKVMDITIPDRPSFTVESADIYDLRFTSELSPVTKNTRHESIVIDEQDRYLSTTWLVYSTGSPTQQLGQLPDELSERYPDMDLENLALKAVILNTKSYEPQQLFEDETSKQRTGNYTAESYAFRGF